MSFDISKDQVSLDMYLDSKNIIMVCLYNHADWDVGSLMMELTIDEAVRFRNEIDRLILEAKQ